MQLMMRLPVPPESFYMTSFLQDLFFTIIHAFYLH